MQITFFLFVVLLSTHSFNWLLIYFTEEFQASTLLRGRVAVPKLEIEPTVFEL